MIIVMAAGADPAHIAAVVARIRAAGLSEHVSRGTERTLIGAIGDERVLDPALFECLPGVERALRVVKEYRLIGREIHPQASQVTIRGQRFGGAEIQLIAGPAAIESAQQIEAAAQAVRAAGVRLLHAGAFLSSDNPYRFQGLGVEGLALLQAAAAAAGLPMVSELTDVRSIEAFLEWDVDALVIGPRHMANTALLREVGRLNKPVILKRGLAASVTAWLLAAEQIAAGGNQQIIFCESGVCGGQSAPHGMLDLGAIAMLKQESHLPVIVDPACASGKAWMVPSLAAAAIAAGADGLWLDVHPSPSEALYLAEQALMPIQLRTLLQQLAPVAVAVGRHLPCQGAAMG